MKYLENWRSLNVGTMSYKVHVHQAHFQDGTSISTHCSGYFATVYFEAWKLIHTAVQPVKGN